MKKTCVDLSFLTSDVKEGDDYEIFSLLKDQVNFLKKILADPLVINSREPGLERKTVLMHLVDIPEVFQFLLENGANPNIPSNYEYPIHLAVKSHNRLDLVEPLYNFGASLNVKDKDGNTPLFILLNILLETIQRPEDDFISKEYEINEIYETMIFLLQKGVDTDIKNNRNETSKNIINQHPFIYNKIIQRLPFYRKILN